MPEILQNIIVGAFILIALSAIVIFPGLSLQEWLEEKFKEADGEPTTWK